MELKNYNVYFFFALLIGISILIFFIVKPFLVPFLIAAILAHLFGPAYRKLLKTTGDRKGLSSIITCLLIVIIIITPLILISSMVIGEIRGIVLEITGNSAGLGNLIEKINQGLKSLPFMNQVDYEKIFNEGNILSAAKSFSNNALAIIQSTYQSIANLIFTIFIIFFSLFYLFIDGGRMVKTLMRLSPLKDKYENVLIQKFNSIVRATIKGTTLIAIIQGALGAVLFWATGVSSPVFLGIVMTISSVIPSVGSGLVWFPVGLAMIILGYPSKGMIILLVGGLVISTIDNLIRPKLVGRDTQMHPLLILFSSLGGIAFFGISGFVVGPVLMSLLLALWDIYSIEFKSQLEKFNA